MQPHYPFIDHPQLNFADYNFGDLGLDPQNKKKDIHSVWHALEAGIVSRSQVWEGYKHNLKIVLKEVVRLISLIDDRMIISSDHGNMLGGTSWPVPVKISGHPTRLRDSNLIRVPWLIRQGSRRDIITENASSSSSTTDQEVRQRLSDLGYVTQ